MYTGAGSSVGAAVLEKTEIVSKVSWIDNYQATELTFYLGLGGLITAFIGMVMAQLMRYLRNKDLKFHNAELRRLKEIELGIYNGPPRQNDRRKPTDQ